MARKTKARFTKKKKADKKADQKTPDGLSPREFAILPHQYESFTIEDPHHENTVTFAAGDIGYVRHKDIEDHEVVPEKDYWIGEILEIRGTDSADVWARVRWFWAPREVAEVMKSFNPDICGEHEKLSSDSIDIISVRCFVDHVDVKSFDETAIYQDDIGEDEWFTRYEFHYGQKRISPKVTLHACPICKVPYTPGTQKILHFCPRPGCRNFYHQACLVKNDYVETARTRRLLETWPDTDREKLDGITVTSDNDPLVRLPAQLIAVADQPIVRGTQGGIVGNIASVVAARQLILKSLQRQNDIPDDWEANPDVISIASETDIYPNTICPSCHSPI